MPQTEMVQCNWKGAVKFSYLTCLQSTIIGTHLFTNRDKTFENLGEAAVLACKMFTSDFYKWFKSVKLETVNHLLYKVIIICLLNPTLKNLFKVEH